MSLARHTAYNLAGQLLPLALSLLTIPYYLRLIGEARFGVLALVWLFFGYMGLFDLGMGQAAARQLSQMRDAPRAEQAQVLRTALLISLALGLLGAAVAWPVGLYFFGHRAAIEEGLRSELLAALPWAVLVVPTLSLTGVLMGGLQARSAFAEINAIGVATNAMLLLAPLAVAQTLGVELPGLVASVAATRVLVLLLLLWRCTRQYPAEAPLSINRGAARQLLRFGGWATVSAAVAPLLLVLDRFLIGSYLGARAVSHYVIPFQLAERTTMLASALGSALFPRLAACALEAERQQLALHALQVLALWTSPLVALAFLLSGPFLSWWISPELAQRSTAVAQVLFLAFWLSSLATVPYTKLLATGRPDLVAKCHLAQLLPYLAFLAVALQAWGLLGAALAFAARVVADFLLLSHWADLLARGLRLLAIPFALLASTLAAAWPEVLPDAWRWALGTALTLALSAWSLMHARQSMPFSGRSHL